MKIKISRYGDDCSELSPSIAGTASSINFPLNIGDNFKIFVGDKNGIPVHDGITCVFFDQEKIDNSYPFGIEVSVGNAKPDQAHGIVYDATIVDLECRCVGGVFS